MILAVALFKVDALPNLLFSSSSARGCLSPTRCRGQFLRTYKRTFPTRVYAVSLYLSRHDKERSKTKLKIRLVCGLSVYGFSDISALSLFISLSVQRHGSMDVHLC